MFLKLLNLKQEVKDVVIELTTRTAPAGGLSIVSAHWWTTINWSAVMSGVLGVLQIAYLLRKWWREETTVGTWMRRKTGAPITKQQEDL